MVKAKRMCRALMPTLLAIGLAFFGRTAMAQSSACAQLAALMNQLRGQIESSNIATDRQQRIQTYKIYFDSHNRICTGSNAGSGGVPRGSANPNLDFANQASDFLNSLGAFLGDLERQRAAEQQRAAQAALREERRRLEQQESERVWRSSREAVLNSFRPQETEAERLDRVQREAIVSPFRPGNRARQGNNPVPSAESPITLGTDAGMDQGTAPSLNAPNVRKPEPNVRASPPSVPAPNVASRVPQGPLRRPLTEAEIAAKCAAEAVPAACVTIERAFAEDDRRRLADANVTARQPRGFQGVPPDAFRQPTPPAGGRPPGDSDLAHCREGAVLPGTVAGCWDLGGGPKPNAAAQRSSLRARLAALLRAKQAAERAARSNAPDSDNRGELEDEPQALKPEMADSTELPRPTNRTVGISQTDCARWQGKFGSDDQVGAYCDLPASWMTMPGSETDAEIRRLISEIKE